MTQGRVLAVFAGRVAPLGPKGVPSAFVKSRVHGSLHAKHLGLQGDEQADLTVHGGVDKAVYAYPAANYPLWQSEFPEHRSLWGIGSLGENLVISGFDEAGANVGDVFQVGSTLLEITQPRKPCFKLALRFDNDQRIAARMVKEGRTGWYFRVIKEGFLAEGDELVLIDRRHEKWSIRAVNRAAYDREATGETLREIAALPELSGAWRNQTISAAASASSKKSNTGFRDFVLSEAVSESETIRSMTFAPVDGKDVPLHEPGQHVQIRLRTRDGAEPVIRRYTVSSPPNGKTVRISVKIEEKGLVSPSLHRLVPGDHVQLSPPQGRFFLDREAGRPVALVSAGVGITPMIPMLHAAVTQDGRYPFVPEILFLHTARNGAEHAFANQVAISLSKHPNATSQIFYTRPTDEDRSLGRFDQEGRMRPALIERLLTADFDFYMCGPVAFMRDLIEYLHLHDVPRSRIKAETFDFSADGAGAALDTSADALRRLKSSATVRFEASDKMLDWNPEAGTLLDLATSNGIAAPSDCRMGLCGTCSTKIMSGDVTHLAPDGLDPEEGQALLCCAIPKTDHLVLDL